jgi:hypothetical protein
MREQTERWMELCSQAAVEQDANRLLELVKEINALLMQKERRLGVAPPAFDQERE